MRNFDELQARVARGELIPRAEMAAKYFPAPADYATVRQWLAGLGLTITREDDNHLALFAQGRVRDVQAALGATFARVSFAARSTRRRSLRRASRPASRR